MNVEMLGVKFVELAIAKTDYLVPHINDNDKEPSWDGDVEVYRKSGDKHKKEDLFLKVPVQVKGHKENNLKKKTVKFSVEMADLKNYLNMGGTTFLVVYINEDGEKHQIYYNTLLPYELKKLISKYGDKKSKRIELKPLPKDKGEIADVFLFAAMHMQKQKSVIMCDPVSMEELIRSGQVTSFSFGYTRSFVDNDNPIEYLFDHETYIYAKLPFGIEIPVKHIKQIESTETRFDSPVTVNGVEFYTECEIAQKKDSFTLRLGKSTEIFIPKNMDRENFTFSLSGTLSERIKDEDFIIQAIEAKQFEMGDIVYPIVATNPEEIESFAISERKAHLNWLKTIKALFDKLGVQTELDCEKVTQKDDKLLFKLARSVLKGEFVEWDSDNDYFPEIVIGNVVIKLTVIKHEEKEGYCRIFPYSNAPVGYRLKYTSGLVSEESYHTLLKKSSMLKCCNIDYKDVVDNLKRFPVSEDNSGALIWLLLEMLSAYDESEDKRTDILEAATEFAYWLNSTDNITPNDLLVLNWYQSIARNRPLEADEIQKLHSIIESNPTRKDVYVATYLLLGDCSSAKKHYDSMEEKERELFDTYPINRFWVE